MRKRHMLLFFFFYMRSLRFLIKSSLSVIFGLVIPIELDSNVFFYIASASSGFNRAVFLYFKCTKTGKQ